MLAKTICAPSASRSPDASDFTVACVPTGMNTGVSTGPWLVCSNPARASPQRACTENAALIGADSRDG